MIIQKQPNPSGAYPALQSWDSPTPPDGYAIVQDAVDLSTFYEYNGFVVLSIETIDGVDTVTAYEPNVEAWEAWKASLPDPEPPEPQISDDEAVAIITDTLTTSEALNIITGGTT